ncbi:MAG: hypothetical protein JWR89_4272 [Tardiphaga sp.]|nr:hypothetical protein [Tardiphaga sp.]
MPPVVVMRLLASPLGTTYREVAVAHQDGQCPCGWCPLPAIDIETLHAPLEDAAALKRADDLGTMAVAGRA